MDFFLKTQITKAETQPLIPRIIIHEYRIDQTRKPLNTSSKRHGFHFREKLKFHVVGWMKAIYNLPLVSFLTHSLCHMELEI